MEVEPAHSVGKDLSGRILSICDSFTPFTDDSGMDVPSNALWAIDGRKILYVLFLQ